jgi:hypothetical protein
MSAALIDQARQTFLTFSLAQIATQRHKLSLEMATIRGMRRKLAMRDMAQAQKTEVVLRDERLGSQAERKIKRTLISPRGYGRCKTFRMTPPVAGS